jgi:molybdopterin-containing oxidoreductase family membrane subunit
MSIQSGSVVAVDHTKFSSGWTKLLWPVWAIFLIAGIAGVFMRITHGHNLAGYGSYVPWGLWIGVYFVGVGISGGAFILGTLGYLFGVQGFSRNSDLRISIILSVSGLLPAFLGVWLDLGRMDRMMNILIHPSFTSMMAFNAWMYNIFLIIAALTWFLSFRDSSPWLKPLLILGMFFSILFPSQSGVFFEAVRTNEFWRSPLLSMLFFVSAITLGGASLLFVRSAMLKKSATSEDLSALDSALNILRATTLIGLLVYVVFEFAEFSITFWNPGAHSPNVEFLLFGDYRIVFWGIHLGLGVVVPFLMLSTGNTRLWVIASLLSIIGFGAARLCILIPGQVVGQIPGIQEAFQDPRLSYVYHITTMEYLVVLLMIAVGMTVFYVGSLLNSFFESSSGAR